METLGNFVGNSQRPVKETRQEEWQQETVVHQNQNQSDTVSVTITAVLLWLPPCFTKPLRFLNTSRQTVLFLCHVEVAASEAVCLLSDWFCCHSGRPPFNLVPAAGEEPPCCH